MDPKVLAKSVAPYRPLLPIFHQVRLYALNVLAGNLSAKTIAAGASCFMCIDHGHLEEILMYLLCQGFNMIPPGSVYTGSPPEFDLVVLPNNSYIITWGANDLSMTLCGVVYPSPGSGQVTVVYTGSCALMQFFGTFAGTRVQLKVQLDPTIPAPPNNLNFSLDAAGNNDIYTWDAPTFGTIVSTEVWVSTDGTTYTLDATLPAATVTYTKTAPAVAAKLYVKLRWRGTFNTGASGFNRALLVYGVIPDWQRRVLVNGGGAPATTTIRALNTFYGVIDVPGTLIPKVKAYLMIVPDGIIAASTPLFKTAGNDPWVFNGGINFDLTVNGLRNTAGSQFWNTGIAPSAVFASDVNGGIGCYISVTHPADGGADVDMGSNVSAVQACQLYTNFNSAFSAGDIYATGAAGMSSLTIGTGFWSINAINLNSGAMYYGSSATGFTTAGVVGGPGEPATITGTRPNINIYAMALNQGGVTVGASTIRRYSAFWINDGFTLAEAQVLYNATQACRVALGGGFV
jgi:hypothetical protein